VPHPRPSPKEREVAALAPLKSLSLGEGFRVRLFYLIKTVSSFRRINSKFLV